MDRGIQSFTNALNKVIPLTNTVKILQKHCGKKIFNTQILQYSSIKMIQHSNIEKFIHKPHQGQYSGKKPCQSQLNEQWVKYLLSLGIKESKQSLTENFLTKIKISKHSMVRNFTQINQRIK